MRDSTLAFQEPSGEMVGLDFYFGSLSSADAIEAVTKQCLESGGVFGNTIYVAEFEGARDSSFEGIYSDEVGRRQISIDSLPLCLSDKNKRVVRIPIKGAIGIDTSTADVVTFNSISKAASVCDSHPVSIVAEGWFFSTPGYEQKALRSGERCWRRFLRYCQTLEPDYAAILNENSLPSFRDLKDAKDCRCFCDFFVSAKIYGERLVSQLEGMYPDAYVERVGKGIFISVSAVYNPKKLKINRLDALKRSAVVSKMLSVKHTA